MSANPFAASGTATNPFAALLGQGLGNVVGNAATNAAQGLVRRTAQNVTQRAVNAVISRIPGVNQIPRLLQAFQSSNAPISVQLLRTVLNSAVSFVQQIPATEQNVPGWLSSLSNILKRLPVGVNATVSPQVAQQTLQDTQNVVQQAAASVAAQSND